METKIIKGDAIQARIFNEVKAETASLFEKHQKKPGIAFIGFSHIPLNKYSIPFHVQMALAAGFNVTSEVIPESTSENELTQLIVQFNNHCDIHAIVLFQPLPLHLNPIRMINKIKPEKEVEGFHPQNLLNTFLPDLNTAKYPMCLPSAMHEMASEAGLQFPKDQQWVFALDDEFFVNTLTHIVVRAAASQVVPHDCSVTFINKSSKNLIECCKHADVLVVVTKFPEYIQPSWLKPGVIIIDIYSNLVKEVPSKKDPDKMIPVIRGGINVESVQNIAKAIFPIPGGLMTVVLPILLRNTLISFKNSICKIIT